jgi:ankyrin repeat protein
MLMAEGADVGAKNRHGTLALHVATWCGASPRVLLRGGASSHIDIKNEFGYSPASIAVEKGRDDVATLFRHA